MLGARAIVARAGELFGVAGAMRSVVQQLDFRGVMPGGDGLLGDVIKNAPIAVGDEFPFERKLEVVELFGGDNVIAATGAFAASTALRARERAICDGPTGRHCLHLVTAPAFGGLAIEQQLPTGFFLGVGERAWFAGIGGRCRGEQNEGEE